LGLRVKREKETKGRVIATLFLSCISTRKLIKVLKEKRRDEPNSFSPFLF
jgi:hypothetical protein